VDKNRPPLGERRDLNPRVAESQSAALPLGYARQFFFQVYPPSSTLVNSFHRVRRLFSSSQAISRKRRLVCHPSACSSIVSYRLAPLAKRGGRESRFGSLRESIDRSPSRPGRAYSRAGGILEGERLSPHPVSALVLLRACRPNTL